MIFSLETWSTLNSQEASESKHLDKWTTSIYPYCWTNYDCANLITPAIYLAPLSVAKFATISKCVRSVSSLKVTS